jgi:hypothetical protein
MRSFCSVPTITFSDRVNEKTFDCCTLKVFQTCFGFLHIDCEECHFTSPLNPLSRHPGTETLAIVKTTTIEGFALR